MLLTSKITNEPLRHSNENNMYRDLRLLSVEGGAYSLMVGLGETYLAALVIAIGLGDQLAGLITTVPVLGGACLQLVSFWGVRRINSNRGWVAFAALAQATSAAALSIFVLLGYASAWNLFLAATLYWFGGLAAGPAWNTWVEHLVPHWRRAAFFGARARICQVCVLIGLLLGGALLRAFDSVQIFAVLFGLAAICRFVSAITILLGTELPEWRPLQGDSASLSATFRSITPESKGFLGYLLTMQVAVYTSAPFFTPYMLNHLGLDYLQYTWLISLGFVGKILAMPMAGRVSSRYGALVTLWIGGIGIIPMAGLWIISDSMVFLSVIQVISGMLWAFYELATMLLFFEKIAPSQRVAALSVYNLGNATAMVVGSVVGGFVLHILDATLTAYLGVFLLSSISRLIPLAWMPKRRDASRAIWNLMPTRMIAVRPFSGAWLRPITINRDRVPHPMPKELIGIAVTDDRAVAVESVTA